MATLNTKTSVVDYLKSKGQDSGFANRAKLATQYGISGYTGSAAQNTLLLSKVSTPAPAPSPAPVILTQGQSYMGGTVGFDTATGKPLAPGGTTPATPDYSKVNDTDGAIAAINDGQAGDVAGATADGTPPLKKSFSDITSLMDELRGAVTPTTDKPKAPNYTGSLLGFRAEYGVNALETQLTDLQAQARDIEAAFQVNKNAETGKPVAMNVIEGRVSEHQKAAIEKLTAINSSIATVNDQLKMKYSIVESLMKTTQMDYTDATSLYDKEMSTNISMFNAARGIDEANKSELERQQDNARSNAQITLNALTATGTTYDTLTPAEQANLTKLGVQSGLGADFFAVALRISSGKDLLTMIESKDDAYISMIYKDGTVKNISTGLTPKPKNTNADGSPKAPTVAEQKTLLQEFLTTGIAPNGSKMGNPRGADGFVDPGVYIEAFNNWTGTAKDFLNYFPVEKNVNPASYNLLPEAIKPKTSSKRTI